MPEPFQRTIFVLRQQITIALLAVVFVGTTTSHSLAQDSPSAVMPSKHRAVLKKYCFECHSENSKEGGVDLENLGLDLGTQMAAEHWQKVLNVLNSGEMPPEDEPQLNASEKTKLLEDLSDRIVVARKILSDSGGVITMRRLNRREYKNTMADLLGVRVNTDSLPDDDNSDGFDTSGASLFLSSDQLERYLELATFALDDAINLKQPKSKKFRKQCEEAATKTITAKHNKLLRQYKKGQAWRKQKGKKPPTDFGFIDAARVKFEEGLYKNQFPSAKYYLDLPETKTGVALITAFGGAYIDKTKIPKTYPAGEYILRVRAGVFEHAKEHERFLEYGFTAEGSRTGEFSVLGCREIRASIDSPEIIEIPIHIGSSKESIALRQRQPNNRDAHRLAFNKARSQGEPCPKPAVWLDWVELEGPIQNSKSVSVPPSNPHSASEQIFFAGTDATETPMYAREIIKRFAKRAFRIKSPSESYLDKLVTLYQGRRDEGKSFVESVKEPLAVVLASPSFLYQAEPTDPRETHRELTDLELAVRLSYFLWSAPPDRELLDLARDGKLSDRVILLEQTNRLIASPQAMEFIGAFAHQWLDMKRLDFFQFNVVRYGEFDDSVKLAARNEIYRTIETLIQEDLSIRHLLKSDFVVVNDLLANYYGIEDVVGDHYRKVKLPSNSPRGGLLGTAAVLAMGSDGERTSPVERGAWVMRKLLNDPPPPAPANVPQLSRIEDQLASARTLLKSHQKEPQCAQCHRKIDPIGYGLQNFDAAGRWREEEVNVSIVRGKIRSRKRHAIDPSGTLPDGTGFKDYFELRDRIAEQDDEFARGFTESLIEFGLGRPYGFSDYELASEILAKAKTKDYSIREFIHALVNSKQFRMK